MVEIASSPQAVPPIAPPSEPGNNLTAALWRNPVAQRWLATAAILSAGFALGGFLLGDGLPRAKRTDRTVSVRGVAERDVTANLAVWTLSFSATTPDLTSAQAEVDRDAGEIRSFVRALGFPDGALETTGVNVSLVTENKRTRYVVRERMALRSTDIARTQAGVHRQFELVRRGVFLEDNSRMAYIYTGLNTIKPAMVAEATRDARSAAEQFARDSGSSVGGIKSASQGYFEVTARDGDQSQGWGEVDTPFKKVRVVTTVNYLLR